MVTTRRMSTGPTPAKGSSPSSVTPSRRRSSAAATPSGSRTPRRAASPGPNKASKAPKAPAAAKASAAGSSGKNGVATAKGVRLLVKALGIYACFIYWGIVQERVTTTDYQPAPGLGGKPGRFAAMITLNASMAVAATIVGLVLHAVSGGVTAPFTTFWRAALSNTIASPIGYLSLRYISFPLMLLVKNCKLVPVMIGGALINGVRYKSVEYVAVALISLGVILFMAKGKAGGGGGGHGHGHHGYSANYGPTKTVAGSGGPSIADAIATDNLWNVLMAVAGSLASAVSLSELRGLVLAMTNLSIDGFTNAEQDRINKQHGVSPYYMMACVNIWSLSFAGLYLLADLLYRGAASELVTVAAFVQRHPAVRADLVSFAFANALGQVFIYSIIDEFGSLVSVTVTVTRKMITLFLSILIHKHPIQWWQWLGVLSVFGGVGLKISAGGQHHGGGKAKAKAH